MATGPRQVDYGPMALPVGDMPTGSAGIDAALQSDALRLRSLLALDAGAAQYAHDDATRSSSTPEDADDWQEGADASRLGDEIERLWFNDGARGAREVRVKLSEAVLPGVWISIRMHAGELLVELRCANEGTRNWLGASASRLAADLRDRLHQSIRVVVLDRDARQTACGHAHVESGNSP
jgi:hypothetical protein